MKPFAQLALWRCVNIMYTTKVWLVQPEGVNIISVNYTLLASDRVVVFNATAIATLDSSMLPGTKYMLKNISNAGILTVNTTSGLIDNVSSFNLTTMQGAIIIFDGTNWWTVGGIVKTF